MRRTLLSLTAACIGVADAQEFAEEARPLIPDIEFDVLVLRLPAGLALPLIPRLREASKAAPAREELLRLVEKKRAKLIAWPSVTSRSGQRAVVEQVTEIRYATEYHAPGSGTITQTTEPQEPIIFQTVPETEKPVTRAMTVSEGIPTAFETRNAGVTFEVEGTLTPEQRIETNLVCSHVRLAGFRKSEIQQKGSGKSVVVEQPTFVSHRATLSRTLNDGETALLGVFKLEEPADEIELVILKTRVVPTHGKQPDIEKQRK